MTENRFEVKFRVYYEDTDAGGVVYHSNYLNFMERARTDLLRSLGFEQGVGKQQGFLFVVQKLNIHYYTPLVLDDCFVVTASISRITKTRIIFEQRIIKSGQVEPSAVGEVVVCTIADQSKKPIGIPEDIFKVFLASCM